MAHLEITALGACYGKVAVLDDVSLSVERGELVGIVGPSGSGKSTLLRALVGLVPPTAGTVVLDGHAVDYANALSLRAMRDQTAIVFQQYNFFQNMNVLENLTVAPVKIRGRNRSETEKEARALLARVGLADKEKAYPDELSGGQQQRVAIARALVLKPAVVLLDEVTAALDPELVRDVMDVVQDLARDGITMLLVSHEMGFIREAAHRVVMMDAGRVVEVGPPAQIFGDAQQERTRAFMSRIIRH
ncbi:amino acid ABC transporter ATP-binding protein [Yoonia vestfoldensis]|uniref:amino acid ABC transporter ATP-binding protein n=1 Tax=Yoonia vestfoldensis TaxID=245188 RepID=UPI0003818BAD|nr:amino acid ABC transporter ATP-binding protein [Yoonia vestfoldensis]